MPRHATGALTMRHEPVRNLLPSQGFGILGSYQIGVAQVLALLVVRQRLHDVNRDVLTRGEGGCVLIPRPESPGCSRVQDRNRDIAQMIGESGITAGRSALHRAPFDIDLDRAVRRFVPHKDEAPSAEGCPFPDHARAVLPLGSA